MKIGMPLSYAGGFAETAQRLRAFEDVGLDVALVPEAYSFDGVSQLGYLAAMTSRVTLASGILNIYSRTPTLLAMTAAGMDYVSDGRFMLGVGASGPQVVEGFHGLPYDAPLGRTREVVEVCRRVWRRERLEHHGTFYDIPLTPARGGSGLGKPLKLINHPVRDSIPMVLAALGPKNVELAAELFEGWEPIFFVPEHAEAAFGSAMAAGTAKRATGLAPLEIHVDTRLLVSEDADELARARQGVREHLALYVGGMGARGKNFYHALATRIGFEEAANRIQDLYLAGRKEQAAAAVPDAMVDGVSLIGPRSWIAERVAAYLSAGVTTLNTMPVAESVERCIADIAAVREIAPA
jgi:F420-dependent oxidoreductase-like protein